MSNPLPAGRMRPSRRCCAAYFSFRCSENSLYVYWQPVFVLIILNLTFLRQVDLNATLARLLPFQFSFRNFFYRYRLVFEHFQYISLSYI